ncbi:hypothetical protein [Trueperella bialowiezensis]|uniref:Uncharacterized protein n=1 Tax=Trueperella bialowiezensis TaxID=312285 RepID=A0A3S4X756_9ACTO|nr:hypothetical protein [Trueperella bialowiezensis]VEI14122.1 Uncharacterised protein [Trueperella bialowiezensis]
MSQRRYVVLTPFPNPQVVAGVLRLRGIDAHVIATKSGVCVVRETSKPEFTDWDIAELFGEQPESADSSDPSDDPANIAGPLSQLSNYGVVLLTAEIGDDVGAEVGVSGLVTAVRYVGGERGDEVAAGMLLNTVDSKVESLVLGDVDLDKDAISTAELTVEDVAQLLGEDGEENRP